MNPAELRIQWHDSDACLNLTCECGEESHYDVPNILGVKCKECGKQYVLPTFITLVDKLTTDE